MKMDEFIRGIKSGDFAIGDQFWLNGIEFEVTKKRALHYCLKCGKQELFCSCKEAK